MTTKDKLLALARRLERMPSKNPTEKDIICYELRAVANELGKSMIDTRLAKLMAKADEPARNRRPKPRLAPLEVM